MNYKILVADDEAEILDLLTFVLESEHYNVITATNGEDAYKKVIAEKPDLVVLDIDMPQMSGFEVCQKIRENSDVCLTPIIILSSLTKTKDKITGIKLGADEYITKPFESFELIARVEGLLKRIKESLSANPLTGLPGNVSIETEIKNRLLANKSFCVIYSDLDNFKSYNDKYGFEKGDSVIRLVAAIFRSAVGECGNSDDFIGHIGGEDFVVISTPDKCKDIIDKIIAAFDSLIPNQYDEETRKKGFLWGTDRNGDVVQFPLMSISFGCVLVEPSHFKHYSQVVEKAKELLKTAKISKGSQAEYG